MSKYNFSSKELHCRLQSNYLPKEINRNILKMLESSNIQANQDAIKFLLKLNVLKYDDNNLILEDEAKWNLSEYKKPMFYDCLK